MRGLGLVLLFAAALPVWAQTAPAQPPPGTPASDAEQVEQQARKLFAHISAGDARAITRLAAFPFQLEGQRVESTDALYQEWALQLRGTRTDLLVLEALEVLTPEQMEKRYGAPPARLAALPWKRPRTYIAVATLSGHHAVAIFHEEASGWRLVGFHD